MLSDISHDEALALLVEAGPEVSLTLKHYKAATPFLLKQFGRYISRVVVAVNSLKAFRALSLSRLESFRALKFIG